VEWVWDEAWEWDVGEVWEWDAVKEWEVVAKKNADNLLNRSVYGRRPL